MCLGFLGGFSLDHIHVEYFYCKKCNKNYEVWNDPITGIVHQDELKNGERISFNSSVVCTFN